MGSETFELSLINWWLLPEVTEYEKKAFGNENGFHATCGEVSVSMYINPEAYRDIPEMKFEKTKEKTHWPMAPKEFRSAFPDGRMNSNPALSNSNHGEMLFNLAVNSICQKVK
jgi:creatinine amidohydrolase